MQLSIIAARSKNGVIGKNNTLPWKLSNDLKFFKEKTLGKTIVMGRKTFESIGRALPKRRNIILSRQKSLNIPGCEIINSLNELKNLNIDTEIMIIGGNALFKEALPLANTLYLTEVDVEIDGDVFFPAFDSNNWQESARISFKKSDVDQYNFDILTLTKE